MSQHSISRRYQLLDVVGSGGMGLVYRAFDRLHSQTVALKQVTTPTDQLSFASRSQYSDLRLALAQEFRTLAALRHPYIISVLDYGFDSQRQPFFTMEWLPAIQTITAYAHSQSFERKVELLIQLLQAIAYLHRRDLFHRDLKPDNVVIVQDQVKVLDFGLATAREHLKAEVVGTLAYMPPEIVQGQAFSVYGDLYGVGIIAYEMFFGKHPFTYTTATQLIQEILSKRPDIWSIPLHEDLQLILERLLSKDPQDRFGDAAELAKRCADMIKLPHHESASIRDSYLQAATFVGREEERFMLTSALAQILPHPDPSFIPTGSAWLIGGESGVGKSRLLDEMRIQAVVRGVVALQGQAIREGSTPYQLWRGVLRYLALLVELSDAEASVFKPLVPDLATLVGHEVNDPPELPPQAAQERLIHTLEEVLKRHPHSILLILEDLQWAGSESLAILKRLLLGIEAYPMLILGSYRSDEAPDLTKELPNMHSMMLHGLERDQIAALSRAMLGEAGNRDHVVDMLSRETEGNVFFMIEAIRALAEEAGDLERIARASLPGRVMVGGIARIVERRLLHVPLWGQALLKRAAVLGRQLDLVLLRQWITQQPSLLRGSLDDWLTVCSDAAVLVVADDQWRFSHDKLREALLDKLESHHERVKLHREAAEVIEICYPDNVTALAHHWGQAGVVSKEAHYAALAGEQAYLNSAYEEAQTWLERALSIGDFTPERRAELEAVLGRCCYALGEIQGALQHYRQVLGLMRQAIPTESRAMRWGLGRELLTWVVGQLPGVMRLRRRGNYSREQVRLLSQVYMETGRIMYYANDIEGMFYLLLRSLNWMESYAFAEYDMKAAAYTSAGYTFSLIPLHPLARRYMTRAEHAKDDTDNTLAQATAYQITATYYAAVGRWTEAFHNLAAARHIAEDTSHWSLWADGQVFEAEIRYLKGDFKESLRVYDELYEFSLRHHNELHVAWCTTGRGMCHVHLGNPELGLRYLELGLPLNEKLDQVRVLASTHGLMGIAHLALGQVKEAMNAYERLMTIMKAHISRPSSFFLMEAYTGAAEIALGLWQAYPQDELWQTRADEGCALLERFAVTFPITTGRALRCRGRYWLQRGESDKAARLFEQSQKEAMRYDMTQDVAALQALLKR